jgi:hypothetical protein
VKTQRQLTAQEVTEGDEVCDPATGIWVKVASVRSLGERVDIEYEAGAIQGRIGALLPRKKLIRVKRGL